MKKFKDQVDLIIILLIGVFLRGRIITRDDFWFDEAFTGLLTKVPKAAFLEILSQDTHPPLYSALCRGWALLFGTGDLSIRSLSLVFGVATIIAVYLLARRLFGKDVATLSALLVALNPFLTSYSVEARSYAFYGLLVVLATYFLVNKKTVLFTIVAILGIFTHFVFFAYLGVLLGYYLYLILRKELKLSRQIPNLVLIAAAFAASLYMAAPRQDYLNIDWVQKADLTNISQSLAAYTFGVGVKSAGSHGVNDLRLFINSKSMGVIIFSFLTIGMTVLIQRFKKDQKVVTNNLLCIFLVLIPQLTLIAYGLVTGNNIYIERYLLPSAIFYLVILANIFTNLFRFETTAMIILIFMLTLARVQKPTYYEGMKMVAAGFERTGEKIAFTSPIDFVVAKYYLYENRQNIRLYDPQDPGNDYSWWPFIEKEDHLKDTQGVLFISPDAKRMGSEFRQLEENLEFKDYQVYVATQ
ncbi:MAG: glycosyltransferase family 39 protein [Patescibacteria group bacterium]|jgi:uncharacterized membrane protein